MLSGGGKREGRARVNGHISKNIGCISFRFAGTDGVSLETTKWVEVLERHDWKCFYLAGELDTDADRSMLAPILQFKHDDIQELHHEAFGQLQVRSMHLTERLHEIRAHIKKILYKFVKKFDISMILAENVLTIPLNLPLGMALTEFLAETGMKCIAHHHDFFWERKRFLRNAVGDILYSCYPPNLPNIAHTVINSAAQYDLAIRTGIVATLIPNVMPFEREPVGRDEYNSDIRHALGVEEDEIFLLQPSRVVQRKGIEHAIELAARIKQHDSSLKTVLVVSHASGDEGFEYEQRVHEYVRLLGVRAIFESVIIGDRREVVNGQKIYSLSDVYPHADVVTYPSIYEGFGNAFLEAVYFRKPIIVNNYSTYSQDIKPLGFDVVEFNDFISEKTVCNTMELLHNPQRVEQMVSCNYRVALCHFSYRVLYTRLNYIINHLWGSVFDMEHHNNIETSD